LSLWQRLKSFDVNVEIKRCRLTQKKFTFEQFSTGYVHTLEHSI